MSYSSEVLADSPVGYWRLGESSGNFADSSGNAITGTANGGPTYSQTSLIGTDAANLCIDLDDVADISTADVSPLNLGDVVTLEAWVKLRTNGTDRYIFDKGGNGATGAYNFRINTSNQLQFGRSTVADIVVSTVTLSLSTTYHCVATKTGSTVKLYLNGVDVTGSVSNSTLDNYAHGLVIGGDINGSSAKIDGWIDEAAVYGTALSAARVLAHYDVAQSSPTFLPRMMVVN